MSYSLSTQAEPGFAAMSSKDNIRHVGYEAQWHWD